jgi:hypothetical protein
MKMPFVAHNTLRTQPIDCQGIGFEMALQFLSRRADSAPPLPQPPIVGQKWALKCVSRLFVAMTFRLAS